MIIIACIYYVYIIIPLDVAGHLRAAAADLPHLPVLLLLLLLIVVVLVIVILLIMIVILILLLLLLLLRLLLLIVLKLPYYFLTYLLPDNSFKIPDKGHSLNKSEHLNTTQTLFFKGYHLKRDIYIYIYIYIHTYTYPLGGISGGRHVVNILS